jgi:hypothetical protein
MSLAAPNNWMILMKSSLERESAGQWKSLPKLAFTCARGAVHGRDIAGFDFVPIPGKPLRLGAQPVWYYLAALYLAPANARN